MEGPMQPTRLPRKKDVALALLEQATVYVHLDPRGEAVRVPPQFKRQPQLVLQVGLNMPVPIKDLHVDDDGVSCTLSFNRSPHFCVIPWTCVFALVGENGRGMVWPDDVPPEVAAEAEKQAKQQKAKATLQVAPPPPAEPAVAATPAAKKRKSKAKSADASSAKDAEAKPAKPAAAAKTGGKRLAAEKAGNAESKKKPARAAKPVAPVAAPALAAKAASALAEPAPKAASSGGEKRKRELPPYLRIVK
jgi:stringent starvation protein B